MKVTIFSAFAVSAYLLSEPAAASTIEIGTFNSGACLPIHCNDSGTSNGQTIDYQQVASSSLFSGPVTIRSYTTYFDQKLGGPSKELSGEYDVYFGYSAKPVGGLSTTLADNVKGPLTLFAYIPFGGNETKPKITTSGIPFHYDPSRGNLLIEVKVLGQPVVPSKSETGHLEADNTGTVISRAYCITNGGCFADNTGIVSTLNFDSATTIPLSSPSSTSAVEFSGDDVSEFQRLVLQLSIDNRRFIDAEQRVGINDTSNTCFDIFRRELMRLMAELREIERLLDLSTKMQNRVDEGHVLRSITLPLIEARVESASLLQFLEGSNRCTANPHFSEGRLAAANAMRPVSVYADRLLERLPESFKTYPLNQ